MLALVRMVWRWRLGIALAVAVSTGLAAAAAWRLPPRYDAEVLLLWSPPWLETQLPGVPGQAAPPNVLDSNVVRGVVAILSSDDMARRVVADLRLQERPEFALHPSRFAAEPAPEDLERARFQYAVALYRRGLRIMNDGRSYAIGINVQSSDSALAAAMANRHAELYLAAEREAKARAASNAREWLDGEVQRLSERLRTAEAALRESRERRSPAPGGEPLEVTTRTMEREVSAARGVYEALLSRQRELAARESVPNMDARLISAAVAPLRPSGPNRPLLLALAAIVALALGAGAAILRELLRGGFASAQALEEGTGLRVMGELPRLDTTPPPTDSRADEAVRSLRVTLARSPLLAGRPRILAVVPAEPGMGPVGLNLARSLARIGSRVLLIETDLSQRRGPLAGTDGRNLAQVLRGELAANAALADDAQPGLRLLTAAGDGGGAVRDLLASPVLGEAMAELRADFDWIILDTPPLGVNLDAVAVALHAQATLLLVREGLTPRRLVHKAIRALKDVGAPVIGTVLAGCRTPRAGVG